MAKESLEIGINTLKKASLFLPKGCGVYKMISRSSEVLYIGKAKNLNKRVLSYANPLKLNFRIQKMVSLITKVDHIITENEALALLLEANLIKEIKPKFNILLKDDKTYPNITIRTSHEWPQLKQRTIWPVAPISEPETLKEVEQEGQEIYIIYQSNYFICYLS